MSSVNGNKFMHLVKVSSRYERGRYLVTCPYCGIQQAAPVKEAEGYHHNCPDAGRVIFMNGHCWVGVPNYIAEQRPQGR